MKILGSSNRAVPGDVTLSSEKCQDIPFCPEDAESCQMPETEQTQAVMLTELISLFLLPLTGIWMMFDLLGLHFGPYSLNKIYFS